MRRLFIAVLFLALSGKGFSQVKVPVQYFVDLLNHGKYDVVYDSIQRFRNKVSYGKSPTLDFLEAKCLCLNGTCQNAYSLFAKIFQCYHLSDKDKEFLVEEIASCQTPSTQVTGLTPQVVVVIPSQSLIFPPGVHGKMGMVYDCTDQSQFIDMSGMPPEEVMIGRIFEKGQRKEARKYWSSLLGNGYRIDTSSSRWIIITPNDAGGGNVSDAIRAIQSTADFYSSYYHLSVPEKLITIFMMPDVNALQEAAKKVHNISLSSSSLGYSNPYDLCLMGISDIRHIGTINHELFHLMIKADVGDMPAWLDEGLACLYATAYWQYDILKGGNTWRTDVLKDAVRSHSSDLQLPTVKLLASFTWDDFNSTTDQNICRIAVNYAFSNHLMMYFQEKRLLQKIVDAYRHRPDVDLKKISHYPSNTEILESAVGEPADTIQMHFASWMRDRFDVDIRANVRENYIESLSSILDNCDNLYTVMIDKGKDRSMVNNFRTKVSDLQRKYYTQWFQQKKEDEMTFYRTEKDRRQGFTSEYANTDDYRQFKQLYDAATNLQQQMRAAVFK